MNEKKCIDVELEKVEIVIRLCNLCSLHQLKEIEKLFVPKKVESKELETV